MLDQVAILECYRQDHGIDTSQQVHVRLYPAVARRERLEYAAAAVLLMSEAAFGDAHYRQILALLGEKSLRHLRGLIDRELERLERQEHAENAEREAKNRGDR